MKDPADILRRIIANSGNCDWATRQTCQHCPLGNKIVDGRPVSCVDFITMRLAEPWSKSAMNEMYAQLAQEELIDLELEEFLLKED